ncbi:hypothetical protein BU24DRAFT_450453 [Aaosphaeria arxii CBS 175.79]|uniref:Uncharacterized protein n=1 Tax=Aaosphaeria arxii CBS 175.79 TaxID=1450172 RepID=A0A6A5XS85_9PLEO|nr:uncharacterized protein BU24DRAFT_450453 [Aaosphaeria arxii CBS 175.79]KAF2015803.1 hypothetical protein BU24DRAFT_450453 [Aaosphaeria arxii CBS 175.79]
MGHRKKRAHPPTLPHTQPEYPGAPNQLPPYLPTTFTNSPPGHVYYTYQVPSGTMENGNMPSQINGPMINPMDVTMNGQVNGQMENRNANGEMSSQNMSGYTNNHHFSSHAANRSISMPINNQHMNDRNMSGPKDNRTAGNHPNNSYSKGSPVNHRKLSGPRDNPDKTNTQNNGSYRGGKGGRGRGFNRRNSTMPHQNSGQFHNNNSFQNNGYQNNAYFNNGNIGNSRGNYERRPTRDRNASNPYSAPYGHGMRQTSQNFPSGVVYYPVYPQAQYQYQAFQQTQAQLPQPQVPQQPYRAPSQYQVQQQPCQSPPHNQVQQRQSPQHHAFQHQLQFPQQVQVQVQPQHQAQQRQQTQVPTYTVANTHVPTMTRPMSAPMNYTAASGPVPQTSGAVAVPVPMAQPPMQTFVPYNGPVPAPHAMNPSPEHRSGSQPNPHGTQQTSTNPFNSPQGNHIPSKPSPEAINHFVNHALAHFGAELEVTHAKYKKPLRDTVASFNKCQVEEAKCHERFTSEYDRGLEAFEKSITVADRDERVKLQQEALALFQHSHQLRRQGHEWYQQVERLRTAMGEARDGDYKELLGLTTAMMDRIQDGLAGVFHLPQQSAAVRKYRATRIAVHHPAAFGVNTADVLHLDNAGKPTIQKTDGPVPNQAQAKQANTKQAEKTKPQPPETIDIKTAETLDIADAIPGPAVHLTSEFLTDSSDTGSDDLVICVSKRRSTSKNPHTPDPPSSHSPDADSYDFCSNSNSSDKAKSECAAPLPSSYESNGNGKGKGKGKEGIKQPPYFTPPPPPAPSSQFPTTATTTPSTADHRGTARLSFGKLPSLTIKVPSKSSSSPQRDATSDPVATAQAGLGILLLNNPPAPPPPTAPAPKLNVMSFDTLKKKFRSKAVRESRRVSVEQQQEMQEMKEQVVSPADSSGGGVEDAFVTPLSTPTGLLVGAATTATTTATAETTANVTATAATATTTAVTGTAKDSGDAAGGGNGGAGEAKKTGTAKRQKWGKRANKADKKVKNGGDNK